MKKPATCPLTGKPATIRLRQIVNGSLVRWHVSNEGEDYLRREHPYSSFYGKGERIPADLVKIMKACGTY